MDDQTIPPPSDRSRPKLDLFLISLLLLFLELACIRWLPAHVLFLTFFTNVVLLACFLGMSIGCLAARQPRNYIRWTPGLLALGMFVAQAIGFMQGHLSRVVDVGNQNSPQMVFFGAENFDRDPTHFVVPVEVLNGFFFLITALALVGPGQELGRALGRLPNRVAAYTVNILGSVAGIVLFAACSWASLSPFWWFLPIVIGIAYFLWNYLPASKRAKVDTVGLLAIVLGLASLTSGPFKLHPHLGQHFWSPYYRVDYEFAPRTISVNLIAHQVMLPRSRAAGNTMIAYDLPHLLNRDARLLAGQKAKPFGDVLVIGAGSGNDVSRALEWGAQHVDAVEIDPVVQGIGQRDHPDHPYQNPRVSVHLDDGRNFLRSTERQYDLIVYALVDSLVLHSSYSNIRLESYLFTKQAFEDVKRCLKPDGVFVMYNFYRQGWIVARLRQGVEEVFGDQPLVLSYPYLAKIEPEEHFDGYTAILAGNTKLIGNTFARHGDYWLSSVEPPGPNSPNGFAATSLKEQPVGVRFGPAEITPTAEPLRTASDDWPFLYLRGPMIPGLSLRGMAVMGGLSLLLLYLFAPRTSPAPGQGRLHARLFFLGAGFMLIETKAVVHTALLFGSTWMVNSFVFLAVLLMILAANLFVLRFRPERLWPYYMGLFASLAVNCLVPLDAFLGLDRPLQVTACCAMVAAPILFAGVIFAISFAHSAAPDRAFGANIAGAMLGGLAEYSSMLLGFQYLGVVAIALYALSALCGARTSHEDVVVEPARSAA